MNKHVYEVDLMRAFIILSVVCEHLSWFYSLFTPALSPARLGSDIPVVAFHFTREGFMFITGLVLFTTYYYRPFHTLSFWFKRFKLIIIPYIAWNIIYILFIGLIQTNFQWQLGPMLRTLRLSLLTGNQFFLYYLFISIQLYLVFPLMLKGLKKLHNYPTQVFIVSFILELGLMALNKFVLDFMNLNHLPTWLAYLIYYRDRFVLTYQFWFVAGAIMAVHYAAIRDYILRHTRQVYVFLVIGVVVLILHFVLDYRFLHESESQAVLVLQPIMVPYSLIVTIAIWLLGNKWAQVRLQPHMKHITASIKFFSAASFGIYLIHPLALTGVEIVLSHWLPYMPMAVRIVLLPCTIALVYTSSGIAAHYIGKVPLLGYIVGQRANLPNRQQDSGRDRPSTIMSEGS